MCPCWNTKISKQQKHTSIHAKYSSQRKWLSESGIEWESENDKSPPTSVSSDNINSNKESSQRPLGPDTTYICIIATERGLHIVKSISSTKSYSGVREQSHSGSYNHDTCRHNHTNVMYGRLSCPRCSRLQGLRHLECHLDLSSGF